MSTSTETIEELATREYKYGFETTIDADELPRGNSSASMVVSKPYLYSRVASSSIVSVDVLMHAPHGLASLEPLSVAADLRGSRTLERAGQTPGSLQIYDHSGRRCKFFPKWGNQARS